MSTPNISASSTMPTDVLERRAVEQRHRLHDSVVGLREELKERLDSKKIARKHLPQAATAAGVLGLLLGYAAAAVFV